MRMWKEIIIIFPKTTCNFISRKKRTSEHHSDGTLQQQRGNLQYCIVNLKLWFEISHLKYWYLVMKHHTLNLSNSFDLKTTSSDYFD